MFSALSSSSCVAISLASLAVSGVGLDLMVRDEAEAGLADALLPDLELRRGRGASFEAVDDAPEAITWGRPARAERADRRVLGSLAGAPACGRKGCLPLEILQANYTTQ